MLREVNSTMRAVLPRYHALDIFRYGLTKIEAGERCVLIVITAIAGSSARPLGTPMIVTQHGDFAGYLSNGCVDNDIALHALQALDDGQARAVRYGKGSPYLDIKLPCGGGLDVQIVPDPDPAVLSQIVAGLDNRQIIHVDFSEGLTLDKDGQRYSPPLRIIAAGRGENLAAFHTLAVAAGIDCLALSPDGEHFAQPYTHGAPLPINVDRWTAIVLLFHDHDYEAALLRSALATDAFYIGAMGSPATHDARILALIDSGISVKDCARLRGPIGLVPSMRDAGGLAVSVLAEIIDAAKAVI